MKTTTLLRRLASWQIAAALTITGGAAIAAPTTFTSVNNDSDILGVAHATDQLCVDPWGLTTGPEGNLHVCDYVTGVQTFYGPLGALLPGLSGTGEPHSYAILPSAATLLASGSVGSPTGVDVNLHAILDPSDTSDFAISGTGGGPRDARLIYCTEDGAVEGYRDDIQFSQTVIGSDQSTATSPAGYTGIALSWVESSGTFAHQLYAADFRQGTIDVFNSNWGTVTLSSTSNFTDNAPPAVPGTAPAGAVWSPFNIHRLDFKVRGKIERRLLVVYALHQPGSLTDIPGPGYGYAKLYLPDGSVAMDINGSGPLIKPGGALNSPWGIAIAHTGLAKLRSPIVIFVGNHGNGNINAYSLVPGASSLLDGIHLGTVMTDLGTPLAFDGLWALHFGTVPVRLANYIANPAELTEDIHNFYFSAGIVGETHGLVGRIELQ